MRLKLIANNRNYCEIESADSNIRKSLGKSPIHHYKYGIKFAGFRLKLYLCTRKGVV